MQRDVQCGAVQSANACVSSLVTFWPGSLSLKPELQKGCCPQGMHLRDEQAHCCATPPSCPLTHWLSIGPSRPGGKQWDEQAHRCATPPSCPLTHWLSIEVSPVATNLPHAPSCSPYTHLPTHRCATLHAPSCFHTPTNPPLRHTLMLPHAGCATTSWRTSSSRTRPSRPR